MDRTKILSIAAVIATISILGILSLNQGNFAGFFGLGAEENQAEPVELVEEEQGMEAGLSFEVLRPTALEATVGEKTILNCPQETETEIVVKNTGSNEAEKLFLEFGQGIKVIACENWSLDEVKPGQEVRARARLCLETESQNSLIVGSANSNKIEILFE